ncbi:hypothetical protein A1OO_19635 [Enterovibrio norvegicus FF-33]|uniref:DUF3306 domain-containing protein n=1 Tax=Enterovibrio norvegicus TaxID=188144 RepID=UPI0003031145|nr:DUF3306 domain-containing protein [Enterovibrio norvegicus]OEE67949.1 hypothetical protein A1OO_19635 [Enterovibrio norvegicus FF-33]
MATDSFLTRWSKRKQAMTDEESCDHVEEVTFDGGELTDGGELAFADAEHHAPTLSMDESVDDPADETIDHTDAPPPPDMQDVARLKQGDSAASFLAKGVSAEIKKAALRKLFHSDAYNVLDGMNDYDLDYSNKASLTAEVAASLRQWTKEKIEDVQEERQTQDVSDDETVLDQTVEQDGESTPPESETKSTHEEKGDNLSYGVRQNVPDMNVDNNSDGS